MPHYNDNGFIHRHGLIFIDQSHLEAFEKFTPNKLRNDLEWAPTVYMLTSDQELRSKTSRHLKPKKREIKWSSIMSTDFGSGHRAALHWAFGLWAGSCWGGWEDDDGKEIPRVDITSVSYSMGQKLRFVALLAQAYRWGALDQLLQRGLSMQGKYCECAGCMSYGTECESGCKYSDSPDRCKSYIPLDLDEDREYDLLDIQEIM